MQFSIFCRGHLLHGPLTKTRRAFSASADKLNARGVKLIIRAMKLTAILLLTFMMHLSAKTVSQTITLKASNISLPEILAAVETQTGFIAVYDQSVLSKAGKINIDAKRQPLQTFLEKIFDGLQIRFRIENTSIVITSAPSVLKNLNETADHLSPPFRGVVQDENNKRLAGVNIIVKGTKKGTVTGVDGSFTIDAGKDDVLVISSIGYQTREIVPSAADPLIITLEASSSPLDQVQIIAYGSTTKRVNTGSVGTVKSEVIEQQPVTDPLLALTGRVSGLDISQTSGVPGNSVKVRIRGQNSIRPDANDPLYIIDGVPFVSTQLTPGRNGASIFGLPDGSSGSSPFNALNPADIESIEVLKDADATAIYGSRGANGVILITTKKGKSGKTLVDLNISSGVGRVNRFQDVLDRRDYLDMRYEAFRNDGEDFSSDFVVAPDLKEWDTTRNTDWQRKLIGGTARYTNVQASVSGGSEQTSFMVGAGYWKETTVFPGDFNDQKISGRFNLSHSSVDRKFNLQVSSNFVHDKNRLPNADLTGEALTLPPVAPEPFVNGDELNWENSTWQNPYATFRTKFTGITTNLISNLRLEYQVIKKISVAVNGGYNLMQYDGTTLYPYSAQNPAYSTPTGLYSRGATYSSINTGTWNVEPVVEFQSKAGPGILQILAGSTFQRTRRTADNLNAYGFLDDALLNNPAAASLREPSRNVTTYLYNAVFGRINYDIDHKYIFNVTARRDGSSRFGPGKQFGNFGAAGIAWLFSREQFIENSLPFLSFGKIRASYGLIGSDNIGEYGYISNYVTVQGYNNISYDGVPGLVAANHANKDFGWETTRKLDLAVELGFINDRILINANYFRNQTSNQLVGYVLPYITGLPSVQYNLPATVRNTGIEIELSSVNIQKKSFSWKTSFNITVPRNRLVSYPDLETSSYVHDYVIGMPLTIYKVWDIARIDPQTGLYVYQSAGKEETMRPIYDLRDADRYVAVDLSRRLYGGFGNTITYKKISLDIFFQFVKQTGSLQKPLYPGHPYNIPQYLWDNHWQKPGDVTGPRFTQTYGETYTNNSFGYDRTFYGDASFIRLKNVFLSYTMPGFMSKDNNRQNLKVYLSGQNLFTITKYKGLDPETTSTGLPPLTVVMAGIQMIL